MTPRLFAAVRRITDAFDGGRLVEIKLEVESDQPYAGELYIRVPSHDSTAFEVGQIYSFRLVKVD
ncbi:MAG: hypothetical protein KGI71_05210 [Patescibacteria group bacterium]|nr:hypothetical protein [Patescibacteria group bacterium]